MSTILDLLEKVELFDAERVFIESIEETDNYAIDMNTDQLYHGWTSEEERLIPSYGFDYGFMKNMMNSLPGFRNPDLKLTGDFHDAFFVSREKLYSGYFEIDSTDWKTQHLVNRYGEKIFGLNPDNETEYFRGHVMDQFAVEVMNRLNLTMHYV